MRIAVAFGGGSGGGGITGKEHERTFGGVAMFIEVLVTQVYIFVEIQWYN